MHDIGVRAVVYMASFDVTWFTLLSHVHKLLSKAKCSAATLVLVRDGSTNWFVQCTAKRDPLQTHSQVQLYHAGHMCKCMHGQRVNIIF